MCIWLQQDFKDGVLSGRDSKELGGGIQAGAVSVAALALVYGVYAGYFKQMVETFFTGLCG